MIKKKSYHIIYYEIGKSSFLKGYKYIPFSKSDRVRFYSRTTQSILVKRYL